MSLVSMVLSRIMTLVSVVLRLPNRKIGIIRAGRRDCRNIGIIRARNRDLGEIGGVGAGSRDDGMIGIV